MVFWLQLQIWDTAGQERYRAMLVSIPYIYCVDMCCGFCLHVKVAKTFLLLLVSELATKVKYAECQFICY